MPPAQLQPFYFQCIPKNLYCNSKIENSNQFKFFLFKDDQKYDSSKNWIDQKFLNKKIIIENQKLEFFIHSFIQKHNVKFTLKLASKNPIQKFIGKWDFFVNDYIIQYKKSNTNRFLQNIELSQNYNVDIQFILQTSKFHLQRAIKSYKNSQDKNFVKIKPNQSLKESNIKEQEQVQIYSKQMQMAKLQQFKLEEQKMKMKKKQLERMNAQIKIQKQRIEKRTQALQQKPSQLNISMIATNKKIILAIIIVAICIYILGSKYFYQEELLQEIDKQQNLKIKGGKKKANKKK